MRNCISHEALGTEGPRVLLGNTCEKASRSREDGRSERYVLCTGCRRAWRVGPFPTWYAGSNPPLGLCGEMDGRQAEEGHLPLGLSHYCSPRGEGAARGSLGGGVRWNRYLPLPHHLSAATCLTLAEDPHCSFCRWEH